MSMACTFSNPSHRLAGLLYGIYNESYEIIVIRG